ncbi:hypothetical protein G3N55_02665 [Dissulfurirhabdus thermomarina]|uniref:Uncharacterized protein n=1 Tax=Dissulfurirhabdus thermomarina TaxID=1765737 RepID=A0A6N9TKI3_DISTH|nr:hypothetical protein [Dissulfurirhabdus thermomarina]NDY41755.1 hypothetical protein [Dissulfurirhabdus thermomarina]NMX24034.1 hypothetical protein [Dissulfurirhabdus thermomarina]
MPRRKKRPLPDIRPLIAPLQEEFQVRFFSLQEIPQAVAWAERGHIAIHENYHSRRRRSFHVICGRRDNLVRFCERLGVSPECMTASEYFRFWHLTWFPEPEGRPPGRPC